MIEHHALNTNNARPAVSRTGPECMAQMVKQMGGNKYVAVGQFLFPEKPKSWTAKIKVKNKGKNGRRFRYPDELFLTLAFIKTFFGISYRNCKGFARAFLGDNAPDHSTIERRINRLEPDLKQFSIDSCPYEPEEEILLSIDSTGEKPSERGKWLRVKWKVRMGFIKLHILVENKTGRIVSFKITDEKTGDAEHLPELLDATLDGIDMHRRHTVVLADGRYDSKYNFKYCAKRNVIARIKVRINSETGSSFERSRAIREQLCRNERRRSVSALGNDQRKENRKAWKKRVGYGKRWAVEGAFSSFKR